MFSSAFFTSRLPLQFLPLEDGVKTQNCENVYHTQQPLPSALFVAVIDFLLTVELFNNTLLLRGLAETARVELFLR